MNNDKNNKIEEILNSLDHCERAAVPGFFYTRLKARMSKEVLGEHKTSYKRPLLLKPVFALASLVLVILINAFVMIQKNNTKSKDNIAVVNATLSESENLQSIAAEYSLNENTVLFDINQEK